MAVLAITQTLKKCHHKFTVFEQIKRLKIFFADALKHLTYERARFYFELTQHNVIHAHGYIVCPDSMKDTNTIIYNELSKRYVGFNCIKKCTDLAGWVTYCEKDLKITQQKLEAVNTALLKNEKIKLHCDFSTKLSIINIEIPKFKCDTIINEKETEKYYIKNHELDN